MDMEYIKCSNCNCEEFNIRYKLIKVPAIMSQTGKDEVGAFPVYECNSCKEIINLESVVGENTGSIII